MKIKYIGNFADGTEWAKAATYNALALHNAGHDVYCTQINYNNANIYFEEDIKELTSKTSDDFDYVIHHYLPKDYKYIGGAINIAALELDMLKLTNTLWIKNIKLMDLIFVPSEVSKECLLRSGIDADKVKVFNHSFNYNKIIDTKSTVSIPELNNKFNFVFIGSIHEKENLESLLIAFHSEFEYIEPVNLYIKTVGNIKQVTEFCDNVKSKMKKYKKFKKEIVIADQIPEEIVFSTLRQCHAIVIPSHGEGWCYPAIEATALGVVPIYTDGIGISEYDIHGYPVRSYPAPCYSENNSFDDLYTSEDNWLNIDVLGLQNKMREVYELFLNNKDSYQDISEKCISSVDKFNFTNSNLVKDLFI